MKSDLNRYVLDDTDRKDNKTASLLVAVSWIIAIGGILRALYMLSSADSRGFWMTLFVSLAAGAFIRGMAEIIRLLQALVQKPAG
ncbi:hypothetical protein GXP70_28980 [Paenibacillus lycopersici]|uniref:Uncharacterized protein n=1 Tax=Paenibacillus lycopersici TaxID=2704462 RepID=A0A6C0G5T2_9BACL|nr:hypothetical protein [Paenibacillus lycopersici]QHT63591.1 hypothetical protein GXP70_28980 [Paenibacillus lycopersici]